MRLSHYQPLSDAGRGVGEGGAQPRRHVREGINNAVARTAGLVSIAVLGIVMTGVFTRTFDASLQALSLPVEAHTELMAQKNRLAAIAIPESLAGETRQAVRRAVEESFVSGFRVVVLIAAILAFLSSLFAGLLILG